MGEVPGSIPGWALFSIFAEIQKDLKLIKI